MSFHISSSTLSATLLAGRLYGIPTLHTRYQNIPSLEAVFPQSFVALLQDPAVPPSAEHGLTGPITSVSSHSSWKARRTANTSLGVSGGPGW